MLRTRTNDEVEILKLDSYVEDYTFEIDKTYSFKGIQGIDIVKYNIILLGNLYFYKSYKDDVGYVGFAYDALSDGAYRLEVYDNSIYLSFANFLNEDVIEAIPTDVRLIEDQGKLQLQLEHDTQVLSIDEDVNDLLGNKFGYEMVKLGLGDVYMGKLSLENSDGAFMYIRCTISSTSPISGLEDTILSLIGNEITSLYGVYIEEPNGTSGTIVYDSGILALDNASTITPSEWRIASYTLVNRITGEIYEL